MGDLGNPDSQTGLPGRTLMAIYMGDILIKGSFPPQVLLYAQGAILLFMVLGWSLIWMKDVSFPNLLATYLDFYLSWLCILYCTVHTILYSTVKGYKREGVSQIFFFSFETSVHTGKFVFYGAMVCHSNIFSVSY